MQTLFQKMRANRGRWVDQPIQSQAAEVQPAAQVPFMVVDGERYVEAPEIATSSSGCTGCAFIRGACDAGFHAGKAAFGGSCGDRDVIYIKVE